MIHPTIQLANGLRIANFSSPHSFVFTTGEELPACSPEVANELKLDIQERERPQDPDEAPQRWVDVELIIRMTDPLQASLIALAERSDVDVIIVPLMVRQALETRLEAHERWCELGADAIDAELSGLEKAVSKARVCRVANRITKTIYPDKFSV